jgi:heme exporter protein CcmD
MMMDWSANHAGFVLAAYAIAFAVLALVVGSILQKAKRLKRQLKDMNLSDPGHRGEL